MSNKQWKSISAALVKEHAVAGFLMAAGFGAYLHQNPRIVQPAGHASFSSIIHLYGSPGCGKTLLCEAVANTVGGPMARHTTLIAAERLLIKNSNGPVFLDEYFSSSLKNDDVQSQLLSISNGGKRVKTVADEGWKTFLISNSSFSILKRFDDNSPHSHALDDRMLEIDLGKYLPRNEKTLSLLQPFSQIEDKGNGKELAKQYIDANKDELRQIYADCWPVYSAALPRTLRKAQTFSLITCGIRIMQNVLDLSAADVAGIYRFMDSLIGDIVIATIVKSPDFIGKSNHEATTWESTQVAALTYGEEPGSINLDLLCDYPRKFSPKLLDTFVPDLGKALVLALEIDGENVENSLKAFMAQRQVMENLVLPDDLVVQ